tara:strand:- start:9970 stop:10404 length:435 start_codon:yes stop_codon:yes gene_type:complete
MKKSYIDNFKKKYPFSFVPFLINLPDKSNPQYKETLNSLSLRHPDRSYLKKILDDNYNNQNQIISDFIKNKPIIKTKKDNDNSKDLSKLKLNKTSFSTENMAKILTKQEKYLEAIKIYEKLISKNSKKKIYFAKKIKELKNKDV